MSLGARLRRYADSITWARFIKQFLGINALLLSIGLILALHLPYLLKLALYLTFAGISVVYTLGWFAWAVRRVVIWRRGQHPGERASEQPLG